MILDQLDRLRAKFPACMVLGFADISTGIVLRVSAEKKPPQERMDKLCASAAGLLNGDDATAILQALGQQEATHLSENITLTKNETCVFLRSPLDPAEALLCICATDIDIDPFLQSARSTLQKIAADQ